MTIAIHPHVVAQYEERGMTLQVNPERISVLCLKERPKARYMKFKNVFHFRFPNAEKLIEYVEKWIAAEIGYEALKAERRVKAAADRKAAVAKTAENIQVGTILVNSWGYDQTNVDAYEVIAKPSPQTVVIREIALQTIEDSEGHMSDTVKPVAGAFIGEPEKRRITAHGVTTQYGNARPAEVGKTFYRSWYA